MRKEVKRYKIASNRLKTFDYTTSWWYYITICTKNNTPFLGKIKNGRMNLSNIGKIVEDQWLVTKELRSYVELDEYVIMPNHFHGIIIINPVETTGSVVFSNDAENKNVLTEENKQTQKMTQRLSLRHYNQNL